MPDDTVVYIALPNLAGGLTEARAILADRLAASPVLAQWWTSNVVANGIDRQVDELLDRLQAVGGTLGDEVVVAIPASEVAMVSEGPIVLALLADPPAFKSMIRAEIARANATAVGAGARPAGQSRPGRRADRRGVGVGGRGHGRRGESARTAGGGC